MAILPGVPGIEVAVIVGDMPAREWLLNTKQHHDAEQYHTPVTTSYIESKSEHRFAICVSINTEHMLPLINYQLPEGTDFIGFNVTIDGVFFGNFGAELDIRSPITFSYLPVKTPNGGMGQQYPVFANIVTVEEADSQKVKDDKARAQNMGIIHIRVYALKLTEGVKECPDPIHNPLDMELAHKATITYGAELTHRTRYEMESADNEEAKRQTANGLGLLGEFVFRYTSQRPIEGENGFEIPEPLTSESTPLPLPCCHYPETQMANGAPLVDITGDDE
ncbi:hypothetical protein F53441_9491 [Fusarium austroafricanum]|uniref:DUF7918 domain-containing protein n=1 Tax=Fusarium austroafricanum TaxID=2364996 RepID=A0A8H4KBQ2_9HYPO|nr:hypothetical protein F53441_9491 [Fusarium austroafricanum]